MSKRTVYILNLFLNLLIVGFIAVALYYGIEVMANSFDTTSPALGIPMGQVYLVFPIGFGTMLMEAILLVYELIKYGPDRIAESN
jgi:TRAP-type C4-dicarboxylate transport system permease small subunit